MATLQVRGMDDNLYKALGARAARDRRSISQEVVKIVEDFLATPETTTPAKDPLLELVGAWDDDRDAETIAKEIRQARRNSKRFEDPADVSA